MLVLVSFNWYNSEIGVFNIFGGWNLLGFELLSEFECLRLAISNWRRNFHILLFLLLFLLFHNDLQIFLLLWRFNNLLFLLFNIKINLYWLLLNYLLWNSLLNYVLLCSNQKFTASHGPVVWALGIVLRVIWAVLVLLVVLQFVNQLVLLIWSKSVCKLEYFVWDLQFQILQPSLSGFVFIIKLNE